MALVQQVLSCALYEDQEVFFSPAHLSACAAYKWDEQKLLDYEVSGEQLSL